ncbi:Bone morphogenetic protein 15 [Lonchura striata]|uniref:Bone morphogenetic protein 15 n=1 Tax=Lonchura striata TaxID=40157 RepID=A0A218V3T2_9PASE|nr:bone morphogenetic protein 15 [Lonchura striata domestica]OWK60626.1 Bone morphogenetic protein 15 [Lonchura striata domestica]
MAMPYSFTSLLLLLLVVPLSQAANQSLLPLGSLPAVPTLPLLQALQTRAPGSPGWQARPASGQPLRYMLDLYRRAADREGRPRRSRSLGTNTIRLVPATSHGGQPWAGRWYLQALTYHVESQPEVEHLLRATVVYLPSLSLAHGRLLCALELVMADEAPRVLLSPTARPRHGWAEVDVTPYLVLGNSSVGSLVLQHVCVRAGRAGGHNASVAPGHPFLILYLNDTQAGLAPLSAEPHRHRRDTGTLAHDLSSYLREQGGEKSDCSLHSFPVSFAQLGWDHWIIAPHRYNPRYCKGTCPHLLRYDYHAPNHAVVQSFVHQLVDASVPRPSCVPYRYSPISVLMIERNGGILYKEFENMIAESCTCR